MGRLEIGVFLKSSYGSLLLRKAGQFATEVGWVKNFDLEVY